MSNLPAVPASVPAPKRGRPRALDDAKRREVCALVTTGCSLEHAAMYVGCAPNTIRREARRNPDFNDQLRQAALAAQLLPLHALRQAATKHWRAAAWMLERLNPNRFIRQDPQRLTPQQMRDFKGRFCEAVRKEIDDPEQIDRIFARLDTIIYRLLENI